MCGRFTLRTPASQVVQAFGVESLFDLQPRYNIAPSQQVPVVRLAANDGRELALLRWGLIPSWADDPSIGYNMINARGESVATNREWPNTTGTLATTTAGARCSKSISWATRPATTGRAALRSLKFVFGRFSFLSPASATAGDGGQGEETGDNMGLKGTPIAAFRACYVPVFVPLSGTNKNAFRKSR